MKYYVTVYEIGRAYGGPEEGGWHYDYGTPIMDERNALYDDHDAAVEYAERLNVQLEQQNEEDGRRHPSSVLSSGDYLVALIDEDIPAPYPQRRPRYE